MQHLTTLNATRSTMAVVDVSYNEVLLMNHIEQAPAHLLIAFLLKGSETKMSNPGSRTLAQFSTDFKRARELVRPMYLTRGAGDTVVYHSLELRRVIKRALEFAREVNPARPQVRTDQLLRALIEESDKKVRDVFEGLNIREWDLQVKLKKMQPSGEY